MKNILHLQINTEVFYKLIVQPGMPKVPKIRSLHIFAISPEMFWRGERGQGELDFLPANEHQNFLQVGSITLGLCSHECPKCPKQ